MSEHLRHIESLDGGSPLEYGSAYGSVLRRSPSRQGLGGQRKPRLGVHVRVHLRAETIRKARATAGL